MFECELRYENLFESEREMFECEQKIESPQGTRMSTVFCAYLFPPPLPLLNFFLSGFELNSLHLSFLKIDENQWYEICTSSSHKS